MCGRYVLEASLDDLTKRFGIESPATNLAPRYNIAPTQPVCAIRLAGEDSETGTPVGKREMVMMRWGLVPFWMKEVPKSRPLINARSETVAEKPSFRGSYRHKRCLVPADGWYEWAARSGQRGKQPVYIRPRSPQQRPFAFAGLWDCWTGPGGDNWLLSLSILTMPAHRSMAHIHHRMPVALTDDSYDSWLDPGHHPPADALSGLRIFGDDDYETFDVSTRVNHVAADGPELISAYGPDQPRLL